MFLPCCATDRFRQTLFSSLQASKQPPEALRSGLGDSRGGSGVLLDALRALLAALEVLLGRSWDALGTFLERSWVALSRSWPSLGDLGSILDPPRADFGTLGVDF